MRFQILEINPVGSIILHINNINILIYCKMYVFNDSC